MCAVTDVLMLSLGGPSSYTGLVAAHLGADCRVAGYRTRHLLQTADILHVHWPENLQPEGMSPGAMRNRLGWWMLGRTILRVRRRGAIVWTAHNLARHEPVSAGAERQHEARLSRFRTQVDIAIAMGAEQLPALHRRFPEIAPDRWRIVPHPHYREVYAHCAAPAATRARLDIPEQARVVAMIGMIRPYKGIPEAIDVFKAAARPDEFLLIGGQQADAALRERLLHGARGCSNIRIVDTPISDYDLASLYRASNLALLNYAHILNSGSVFAALSLDCPTLAPRTPTFDALAAAHPGWVTLFEQPLTPEALRRCLDRLAVSPPAGSPDLSRHDPGRVGAAHRLIYAEALALAAQRRAEAAG